MSASTKHFLTDLTRRDGVVRVFVSSTFHDLGRERDVLVKQVFPQLRRALRTRGLDIVEVDLRWGITAEQSEAGATISTCLAEIDRCRPYFIGLLGDRYGWRPPPESLAALQSDFPNLHVVDGQSVTEIEMIHGALAEAGAVSGRALFYMRAQPPSGVDESAEAQLKLNALRDRIRASGLCRLDGFQTAEEFARCVHDDLMSLIARDFPEREHAEEVAASHAAFAREHATSCIGRSSSFSQLDAWFADANATPLLVTGAGGLGKSALMAAFCAKHIVAGDATVFEHYVESAPDSDQPQDFLARLAHAVTSLTGSAIAITGNIAADAALCFGAAAAHARASHRPWLIAVDGLDLLAAGGDLRWLPPPKADVKLLATSRDDEQGYKDRALFRVIGGATRIEAAAAGEAEREPFSLAFSQIAATHAWRAKRWGDLRVEGLSRAERATLIEQTAARFGKSVSPRHVGRMADHDLAGRPLFLTTIVDELRVSSDYHRFDQRLAHYLGASSLPDLFTRVLERLEADCATDLVTNAFCMIACSRNGIEETLLLRALRPLQTDWSSFLIQAGNLLRTSSGRIKVANAALREACAKRYLSSPHLEQSVRITLAGLYTLEDNAARAAEEVPWQLRQAKAWNELEAVLTDPQWWPALTARGVTELLEHWMALQARGRDVQTLLYGAWRSRRAEQGDEGSALGANLAAFLRFAGCIGDPTLRLHLELLEQSKRRHGAQTAATAEMTRELGVVRLMRGEVSDAETLLRNALEVLRRALGAGHPSFAATAIVLARIVAGQRRDDEAESMARTALEALQRSKGDNNPDTLAALRTLAEILARSKKEAEALRLRRTLLQRCRALYGEEHPETLIAMDAYIDTRIARGDLNEAKYEARAILEARERLLGVNHPLTLSSAVTLALVLLRLDDQHAEPLLEYALNRLTDSLGGDHPDTLTALHRLADRLVVLRKSAEAVDLLQKVYAGRMRALGASHPDTLYSGELLGWAMFGAGQLSEAEQLIRQLARTGSRQSAQTHTARSEAPNLLNLLAAARRDPSVVRRYVDRNLAYGPALGVAFDIDALNEFEYGRAAYRVLFDGVSPDLFVNTRWRDGDSEATLNGMEPRIYLVSIEANSAGQIVAIRTAIQKIRDPALGPGSARFTSGQALEREPLVVAMRIGAAGVPDWSAGSSFPLEAWCASRNAREGKPEGDIW